jgi:hypothetical protein
MHIPFAQLPDHSRIWLYQSDKTLSQKDIAQISTVLQDFCENWVAHQQPMHTSFEIFHDRLIILAADEEVSLASGCSIDSSVAAIRQLGDQLSIDFFKRTDITFLQGDNLCTLPLATFKKQLGDGTLSASTVVFNTLIEKKSQLSDLLVPVEKSWLSRFIPATSV